jgi:circadian clock protein KaiC
MLLRVLDLLKARHITTLMTSLTSQGSGLEFTDAGISSVIDTWILLRDLELQGERNRVLYVLKSRGMAHSNQLREFLLTSRGIRLLATYLGPSGVLTGTARIAQEARERAERAARTDELRRARVHHQRRSAAIASRIAALQGELAAEAADLDRMMRDWQAEEALGAEQRRALAISRKVAPRHKPVGGAES